MGIDYGRGTTNINPKTGIRFGIVNMNNLHPDLWGDVEPVFAFHCPHCGADCKDNGLDDRKCSSCKKKYKRDDAWSEEPVLNGITQASNGKWSAWIDSYNDAWFTRSKFLYHSRFASPCAPGAGCFRSISNDPLDCICYGPDPDMWPEEIQQRIVLVGMKGYRGMKLVTLKANE